MADVKRYPGKRYNAAGETKYITGPDDEAPGWFDSPKKAADDAQKPVRRSRRDAEPAAE